MYRCRRHSLAIQQITLRSTLRFFSAEPGVELVPATTTDMALEVTGPRKAMEDTVAAVMALPELLKVVATQEAQVAAAAPLADLPVARAWVLALCSLVRVAVVSTSTPSCST